MAAIAIIVSLALVAWSAGLLVWCRRTVSPHIDLAWGLLAFSIATAIYVISSIRPCIH